jgi:hypothetical protein
MQTVAQAQRQAGKRNLTTNFAQKSKIWGNCLTLGHYICSSPKPQDELQNFKIAVRTLWQIFPLAHQPVQRYTTSLTQDDIVSKPEVHFRFR